MLVGKHIRVSLSPVDLVQDDSKSWSACAGPAAPSIAVGELPKRWHRRRRRRKAMPSSGTESEAAAPQPHQIEWGTPRNAPAEGRSYCLKLCSASRGPSVDLSRPISRVQGCDLLRSLGPKGPQEPCAQVRILPGHQASGPGSIMVRALAGQRSDRLGRARPPVIGCG